MDFKSFFIFFSVLVIILFSSGCSNEEKMNTTNTFYIELVNFNHDSLKQNVSQKLFGKASYYKNSKLEIVSLNYLIEDESTMHYYKNVGELGNEIKPETKKIRIEFGGKFTNDSITYSLQKFLYRGKQWKKTSDMGFIKGTNTYYRAKMFAVDQYGSQILNNVVLYSYN